MVQFGIKHSVLTIRIGEKMKKKPVLVWFIFGVSLIGYIAVLLMSIQTNDIDQEEKMFHDWYDSYVLKNKYGSFVNTSNIKKSPIALSEGQGYGLVITVLAGEKGYANEEQFNELLTYYDHFKVSEMNSLMKWKQEIINGKWQSVDNNNATDGDLDIAYALFKAAEVWPNSKINYQKKALTILDSIKKHNYNEKTKVLTVGNWATNSKFYANLFRPSDVMPLYFDLFFEKTDDLFWSKIKKNSLELLTELSEDSQSGLIPDFAWIGKNGIKPAKSKDVTAETDGDYGYNSLRIPLRLAKSEDEKAKEVTYKLLTFFANQDQVKSGYSLEGKPLTDYPSVSYSAPLLLASENQSEFSGVFSDASWVMYEPITGENYYGDSLKILAVLQLK